MRVNYFHGVCRYCKSDEKERPRGSQRALERASSRARRAGFSSFVAADWSAHRNGGGGVHCAHRTAGNAPLSGGQRRVEAGADTDSRLAGHGLSALPLFSQCARQRRAADESRPVCAGWIHLAAHRSGQVFLHGDDAGQRDSVGPRGAVRSGWCGNRLGARPRARIESGKGEGADSRRSGGRHCRGLQHADGGGAVCSRRGDGRLERAGTGVGGAGLGYLLGDVEAAVGQQPAFSSATV